MMHFPIMDEGAYDLFNMVFAPMQTKILFTGLEIDIFSDLETPKDHHFIATKNDLHPDNTEHLLNTLVAIGLVAKIEGQFKNTALASKYLVRDAHHFMGSLLLNFASDFNHLDIMDYLKNGPEAQHKDQTMLEKHAIFGDYTSMLIDSQRLGRAHEYSTLIASLPEFPNFKKMLDLGSGPGLLSVAIIEKHPHMQGVLFDTPQIEDIAKKTIKDKGLSDRIEVLTGDFMNDGIGEGYDLILAVGALNFAKHDLHMLMTKLHKALNPRGVFVCISEGMTNAGTKPEKIVLGWLPSLLKGCDFRLTQGEVSDTALAVGFKSVYKQTIPSLMGQLDVDIIRK